MTHSKVFKWLFAIDQDNSALSRDLLTAIDASDNLHILRYGETTDDFADAVKRGQVYLCVMIPANFERDLKRGHGARVVVLVDGTNTLVANVTYRSLRTVIATYSAGAQAKHWLRGGFPRSFLAASDEDSAAWRKNFIQTFLERDLPQMGIAVPAATLRQSPQQVAQAYPASWRELTGL